MNRKIRDTRYATADLLLVGGGHAMLPAVQRARRWTAAGAEVALVSDRAHLYYSGMVPEYLGGVYTEDEVRIDLRRLCRRAGVRFVKGRAIALDPAARTVRLASGAALTYDLAAFDIGARNPGSPPRVAVIRTKPLHRITQLEAVLQDLLRGDRTGLTVAIVGGGAAGVEVALNVTARLHAHGRADAFRLHVVERGPHLLSSFPAGMRAYAERALTQRGARLHLGTRVTEFTDEGLTLDGGAAVPADAVLWATGSAGPPLFAAAGLTTDDRGFVRVRPTLQCTGNPRLFAAGDGAVVEGHEDLARVGVHAVKQGPVLAANLERALTDLRAARPPQPEEAFSPYPVTPLILSTGRRAALWTAGPVWLRGAPFLRLKHFVDQRWMRKYHGGRWQRTPLWRMMDAAAASDGRSAIP